MALHKSCQRKATVLASSKRSNRHFFEQDGSKLEKSVNRQDFDDFQTVFSPNSGGVRALEMADRTVPDVR